MKKPRFCAKCAKPLDKRVYIDAAGYKYHPKCYRETQISVLAEIMRGVE